MCSKGAKEAADELQKEDPEAMQLEIIHQERKVVDILEKCHALSWEVCSQRLGVYKRCLFKPSTKYGEDNKKNGAYK